MMLKNQSHILAVLACLLVLCTFASAVNHSVEGVGLANVVVTSVYWGTNPLSPSNAHPGDVNVQLSIVLSNVGDDVARNVNATLFLGPPLLYSYYERDALYSATASSVWKMAGDIGAGLGFTLAFTMSVD